MMWHYFPIGLRFPVGDFSEETKRRCWQIAIAALTAAGGEGATLYETQEPYDFGTDGPVYICIACYENIKQSRAVGKKLYAQDALMARLAMHRPFAQANYLESYGPYPEHGTLNADGTVARTETEFACFPPAVQKAVSPSGKRLLLAAEQIEGFECAETVLRKLAIGATEAGFCAARVLLPNAAARVRALVTMLNGRYDTVSFADKTGAQRTETIGVLPGVQAVIESNADADVLLKALDLGMRRFLLDEATAATFAYKQDADARLAKCAVDVYRQNDALNRIGFDAAAKSADAVVLVLGSNIQTAESLFERLRTLNKPILLFTTNDALDVRRMKERFPQLLQAVTCPETPESYAAALRDALVPAIANLQ